MSDEPRNTASAVMLVEEARRMLDAQSSALESLRVRAIGLLSVGALVAGFFGPRLPAHRVGLADIAVWVALASFGASVALVMWIVSPHYFHSGHKLARHFPALESGERLRTRDLAFTWARGYEEDRAANEDKVKRLMAIFTCVCGLVAVQVVAWACAAVR